MATRARESMRDKIKRRAQETTHGGGGGSVSLPEGVKWFENDGKPVELDFVPYEITSPRHPEVLSGRFKVGDLIDSRVYWIHRDIGVDQKSKVCLKSIGKPCPICEAYNAAKKNSSMAKEDVDALRSKERVLYNVIDLGTKDQKVQVWDVSYHLFTKMLEEEQTLNENLYGYADLDNGSTLSLRFRQKKMGKQEFYETSRIDGNPRELYGDEILSEVVNFDEALQILSYEQLEAVFLGTDNEPEGEDSPNPLVRQRGERNETPPARAALPEESAPSGRRSRAAEPDNAPNPHRHDPDKQRERGGRAAKQEPAQEEDTPPSTPRRGAIKSEPATDKKPEESTGGECPSGHSFGIDTDKQDECDACDVWQSCRQAKKASTPATSPKAAGRRK